MWHPGEACRLYVLPIPPGLKAFLDNVIRALIRLNVVHRYRHVLAFLFSLYSVCANRRLLFFPLAFSSYAHLISVVFFACSCLHIIVNPLVWQFIVALLPSLSISASLSPHPIRTFIPFSFLSSCLPWTYFLPISSGSICILVPCPFSLLVSYYSIVCVASLHYASPCIGLSTSLSLLSLNLLCFCTWLSPVSFSYYTLHYLPRRDFGTPTIGIAPYLISSPNLFYTSLNCEQR